MSNKDVARKRFWKSWYTQMNSVAETGRGKAVVSPHSRPCHKKSWGLIIFMFHTFPQPTAGSAAETGTGRSVATGAPIVARHALWHVPLRNTTIKVYIIWHISHKHWPHTWNLMNISDISKKHTDYTMRTHRQYNIAIKSRNFPFYWSILQ